MILNDKINKAIERIDVLEAENNKLLSALQKKESEIKALEEGLAKYSDKPKMIADLNALVAKRLVEAKEISGKIDLLDREYVKINRVLDTLYAETLSSAKTEKIILPQSNKISSVANKLELPAVASKQKGILRQTQDDTAKAPSDITKASIKPQVVNKKIDLKTLSSIKQKEKETNLPVQKNKPQQKTRKDDLYSTADMQAKAQEEFLSRNSSKYFGNA